MYSQFWRIEFLEKNQSWFIKYISRNDMEYLWTMNFIKIVITQLENLN